MTEIATQTDDAPLLAAAMPSPRRYVRLFVLLVAGVGACVLVYLAYLCPSGACGGFTSVGVSAGSEQLRLSPPTDLAGRPLQSIQKRLSFDELLAENFRFDVEDRDVMVFLHIQKTGGTAFGRHLVHDLQLKRPCECHRNQKRCQCFRPGRDSLWLFSRYSTGWRCGLHADWTELTACVDEVMDRLEHQETKRRYFYVTLLRDPVERYLSEWGHVRRGATWRTSRHWCGGREATETEIPSCYVGDNWRGVTLDEFLACESNLAANRQTRMLADLHLVGCYQRDALPAQDRDRLMLASAKHNLQQMAFFGLTEEQQKSQYIFEVVFNMRFLTQFAAHNKTHADSALRKVKPRQLELIRERNHLDQELYDFARDLLLERFQRLRANDEAFDQHFASLGRPDLQEQQLWER